MGKTIDFEWYKVFYEVALRGSVSGAAADLAVSQPAVSQSIRNLERAFGVRLFHRRSRGVELTETGRKLYSYVRESYRLLMLGERTVREFLDLAAGSLLIGVPDDLGTSLITPLFKEFRRLNPEVSLHTQTLTDADVLERVAEGGIELGFVTLPAETGDLALLPLNEIEDLFAAGPEFDHLRGRTLSSEDLLGLPLAVPVSGGTGRAVIEEWLEPPAQWVPAYEASSPEALRRFAAAGLGVAWLPREGLGDRRNELFTLEIDHAPPSRRGALVYRGDIPLSVPARRLYEMVSRLYS